ncbi:MAG: site-specific DNA-methyltransferase [Burkholderiaceae bacterium]
MRADHGIAADGRGAQTSGHGCLIRDDCLPAMQALTGELAGRVDLVLTDPPYNTGGRFTYHDDFGSAQRWLNFIAPRLAAARDLLADDGAMVVHIDEHQHHHLKGLLERLFGERNALGDIVWDKLNPKGDAGHVATQHETLIAFAKNRATFKANRHLRRVKPHAARLLAKAAELVACVGSERVPDDLRSVVERYSLGVSLERHRRVYSLDDARTDYWRWLQAQGFGAGVRAYRHLDDDGRVYRTVSMAWPNKRRPGADYFVPLLHPRTGRPCPLPLRGWRNPSATMQRLLREGQIVFGDDETKQPERKYWLDEHAHENLPSVIQYGGSDDARLRELGIPFDNPKPVGLTRMLVDAFTGGRGLVLDPFAGSGTVGHACLEMAAEGGDIRFILIQNRESLATDQPHQADAAEFCRSLGLPAEIATLTAERLRRCAARLRIDQGFIARLSL